MIAAIGLRLGIYNSTSQSTNPTLYEAQFIAWTQTEMNYSVISATIPTLRPLVNNLATYYGGGHGDSGNVYGDGSGGSFVRPGVSATHDGVYQMSSLKSKAWSKNRDKPQNLEGNKGSTYSYGVAGGRQGANTRHDGGVDTRHDLDGTSLGSNDSQKMIIRNDVTWQVQHDGQNLEA